jgi:nucleoside phosphorylase
MTPVTLSHDDYTVAWICALPLEMATAKAMLDEIHGRPSQPQPSSDQNAYTLGRVHGHNVVVACLPSGVYGTTSATTVVEQMRTTFRFLKFGLMVGIGGGVPGKVDIRLGDVVVSNPTPNGNGVVQYDYGKSLRDGRFQRTGFLNKPPQILLTAVSQIQSNHITGKRGQVKQYIADALETNITMKDQFSRPDNDWLFYSTYSHEEESYNCSACDLSQLINDRPLRETDEPFVHYGLIASGNKVIKDAQIRDKIAKELDILCFEMEAAGLMDQLPCLVIRGICDYCDSHKQKHWQNYASLAAAAYAKLLLSVVPHVSRQAKTEESMSDPASTTLLFVHSHGACICSGYRVLY